MSAISGGKVAILMAVERLHANKRTKVDPTRLLVNLLIGNTSSSLGGVTIGADRTSNEIAGLVPLLLARVEAVVRLIPAFCASVLESVSTEEFPLAMDHRTLGLAVANEVARLLAAHPSAAIAK